MELTTNCYPLPLGHSVGIIIIIYIIRDVQRLSFNALDKPKSLDNRDKRKVRLETHQNLLLMDWMNYEKN